MKEINIKGFITLILLIAIFCGVGYAWDIIVNVATYIWEIVIHLPQLIRTFIPFLGIEEKAVSALVFGIVLMIASGLGIFISHKCEAKLWIGISGAVEIISTIITIFSVAKLN